ncbi:MAG: N-acetylglucosamine-6-phosphate deacetylase [Clostridia bacterium]|nr:N-acetylglucosamine-6-phosphate deacetylase [Clostridia bacterium]
MKNAITKLDNYHILGARSVKHSLSIMGDRFCNTPVVDSNVMCAVDEITNVQRIDLHGCTVMPALFDTHTHGAVGVDYTTSSGEQIEDMLPYYTAHGITSILATIMTQDVDIMCRQLDTCAQLMGNNRTVKGIHLEGPFLSAQYKGAMEEQYLQPISINLFDRLFNASKGYIKQITIAPELVNAPQLTRYATDLGITVSLGHTGATVEQAQLCVDEGAKCVTHMYNAMDKCFDKGKLLDYYINNDELYCELICDGQHIPPPTLNRIAHSKCQFKTILVSDSIMASGVPYGTYSIAGQTVTVSEKGVFLANGKRAGSNSNNFANLLMYCQYTDTLLQDAIKCATINPAQMLGYEQLGSLSEGYYADFIVIDNQYNLLATYQNGVCVYKSI